MVWWVLTDVYTPVNHHRRWYREHFSPAVDTENISVFSCWFTVSLFIHFGSPAPRIDFLSLYFLEFHINGSILYVLLGLSAFTQYNDFWDLFMLSVSIVPSFLLLINSLLCRSTSFVYSLTCCWTFGLFLVLGYYEKLLWPFVCKSVFPFLLDKYPGVQLVSHMIALCLTL